MASRSERKLAGSGSRMIGLGAPFVAIGVVLAVVLNGTAAGIGVAFAMLGAIPVVVGVVLLLTAGVEHRARERRPFA
jgi:hypothetical protein